MFTILSIVNKPSIAEDYLLKSLGFQTEKHELILIDNTSNKYSCAAKAFNEAKNQINGDYVIFIHQDVFLPNKEWLKTLSQTISSLPQLGIAGVAGTKETFNHNKLVFSLKYYLLKIFGLKNYWFQKYVIENVSYSKPKILNVLPEVTPFRTQTVDEAVMVVPTKVFKLLQFDEVLCDGWDLYGVDYSLSVNKLGLKTYTIPLPIFHFSEGKISADYRRIMQKLIIKHKYEHLINTTCGLIPTLKPLANLLFAGSVKYKDTSKMNFVKEILGILKN